VDIMAQEPDEDDDLSVMKVRDKALEVANPLLIHGFH